MYDVLPVAEQKATCEGEDEEDDRKDQLKFFIFIFVSKSVWERKGKG